jgi:hypothetical protein
MIAPQDSGLPYHEWFVEFESEPQNLEEFAEILDKSLQQQNSYYYDLITGSVLKQLQIRRVKKGGFMQYMKAIGKLGGQNKVQRLANDRGVVSGLESFVI